MSKCAQLKKMSNFQIDGVNYAMDKSRNCRALIADEMGLGKTLQAMAIIASYNVFPVLIVCPASLRLNWAEELERWLGELLRPRDVHV